MNMMKMLAVASMVAISGCFTLFETDYPEVVMGNAAGQGVKVQLAGFDATITTYVPIYGYETVVSHGGYYRHHGPFVTTYATETYVPHASATSAFIDRATEAMERSGFILKTGSPDYRVEVKFSGPVITTGDQWKSVAWSLLTAFTADYGVQTWTASLGIYDVKSGELLMYNDYEQKFDALVWGPIPLISPNSSDVTSYNRIQSWCLTALTDRTMADATAFLSPRATAPSNSY